jgi:hypothetical protein
MAVARRDAVIASVDQTEENPGDRLRRLYQAVALHVGNLPEHGSPVAASDSSIRRNGSSVAKDETVREIAVRRVAGGALREVPSQER